MTRQGLSNVILCLFVAALIVLLWSLQWLGEGK
jgi:hypothetical protein